MKEPIDFFRALHPDTMSVLREMAFSSAVSVGAATPVYDKFRYCSSGSVASAVAALSSMRWQNAMLKWRSASQDAQMRSSASLLMFVIEKSSVRRFFRSGRWSKGSEKARNPWWSRSGQFDAFRSVMEAILAMPVRKSLPKVGHMLKFKERRMGVY